MSRCKQLFVLTVLLSLVVGCSGINDADETDSLPTEYDNGLNMRIVAVSEPMPQTTITFDLPVGSEWRLHIQGCTGYLIWEADGAADAGTTSITWNETNMDGESVEPGVFIFELTAGSYLSRKLYHSE